MAESEWVDEEGWEDEAPAGRAPEATPAAGGPSRAVAFLRGGGQGVTLGAGDEGAGFLGAIYQKWPVLQLINPARVAIHLSTGRPLDELVQEAAELSVKNEDKSFGEVYRGERDMHRRDNAAAEKAHGGYYLGGNLVGGALTAPLLPGGQAKTLWQTMKQGAKLGGLTGAGFGLGTSEAELSDGSGITQAAGDTTLGGLLGAGLGGALPPAAAVAGYLARNIGGPAVRLMRGGYVTPTPEAQRLMAEGADLTLGQMNPASTLGRFEEIAASKSTGGSLKTLRDQGNNSARDVVLRAAGAPNAKAPTRGADVAKQLEELRAGFTQIYDEALDGARLQPDQYLGAGKWRGLLTDESVTGAARTKGAFELAAGARDIDASPAVRRRALAWLTDKAQTLVPTKTGPNAGTVDARSIHALRTQLRDKKRKLGTEGDDRQLREIYTRAEEFVSELLEGQLPPEKAAMLKGADTAYRNLLATEEAAERAFVQGREFTPGQLLMSMRKGGATPEMEALTRDAHSVLTAAYPLTGVQSVAGEVAPLTKYLGPGFAHLSNTVPGLRRHALTPLWQPGLPARALSAAGRGLEGAVQSPRVTSTAGRTLYDLLTPPAPPMSSVAQAEDDLPAWATR